MLKVLVNAYACSPILGSEPGMAWHWITELSKYCELYVITEGEWRNEIEKSLLTLPTGSRIHFYYNPVSEKVREICWNQGDWRFYYYYRIWQKKTLVIAQDICKQHKIEIIHQLNMVGFREPGLLWKIKGPKYVWGPIGGMEKIPLSYLKGAGMKRYLFCTIKNIINTLQYNCQPNVRKAIGKSDALISAVRGVDNVLRNRYNRNSHLIPETGCCVSDAFPIRPQGMEHQTFRILWVGRFIETKKLDLALQVISKLDGLNFEFHICGSGNDEQVRRYKDFARKIGVEDKCIWHGIVEHDKVQCMMADSDLFLFTSIMEATSTVILEAISSGLPILCFNTCGFGPLVTSDIGRKVEVTNPDQSVIDFSNQIKELYHDRKLLDRMSINEIAYRSQLSWENNAMKVYNIYKNVVEQN